MYCLDFVMSVIPHVGRGAPLDVMVWLKPFLPVEVADDACVVEEAFVSVAVLPPPVTP